MSSSGQEERASLPPSAARWGRGASYLLVRGGVRLHLLLACASHLAPGATGYETGLLKVTKHRGAPGHCAQLLFPSLCPLGPSALAAFSQFVFLRSLMRVIVSRKEDALPFGFAYQAEPSFSLASCLFPPSSVWEALPEPKLSGPLLVLSAPVLAPPPPQLQRLPHTPAAPPPVPSRAGSRVGELCKNLLFQLFIVRSCPAQRKVEKPGQ